MKFVRSARGYKALKLEDHTVGRDPVKVSNEDADKIQKAADEYGFEVVVVDADDDAAVAELYQSTGQLTKPTPDLAAGVAYVTGSGDPVQSPGLTPDGGTPEQAGAQDAAVESPSASAQAAANAARASQSSTPSGSGSSSTPA
jgi:transcription elongation factor